MRPLYFANHRKTRPTSPLAVLLPKPEKTTDLDTILGWTCSLATILDTLSCNVPDVFFSRKHFFWIIEISSYNNYDLRTYPFDLTVFEQWSNELLHVGDYLIGFCNAFVGILQILQEGKNSISFKTTSNAAKRRSLGTGEFTPTKFELYLWINIYLWEIYRVPQNVGNCFGFVLK